MSALRPEVTIRQGELSEIPPWSFHRPGMSEEGAVIACCRHMGITDFSTALVLLWKLRESPPDERTDAGEYQPTCDEEKTP